ncbi:unnamed protein product [Owenia fusiformis]|uniref:Uncharacterized protein n=1 Tax=Owenia fusiformis TaxID=6347 RepID=A0A8S4PPB9_OWEFU|nr:unnamed protein product [Owenia fusiformis]
MFYIIPDLKYSTLNILTGRRGANFSFDSHDDIMSDMDMFRDDESVSSFGGYNTDVPMSSQTTRDYDRYSHSLNPHNQQKTMPAATWTPSWRKGKSSRRNTILGKTPKSFSPAGLTGQEMRRPSIDESMFQPGRGQPMSGFMDRNLNSKPKPFVSSSSQNGINSESQKQTQSERYDMHIRKETYNSLNDYQAYNGRVQTKGQNPRQNGHYSPEIQNGEMTQYQPVHARQGTPRTPDDIRRVSTSFVSLRNDSSTPTSVLNNVLVAGHAQNMSDAQDPGTNPSPTRIYLRSKQHSFASDTSSTPDVFSPGPFSPTEPSYTDKSYPYNNTSDPSSLETCDNYDMYQNTHVNNTSGQSTYDNFNTTPDVFYPSSTPTNNSFQLYSPNNNTSIWSTPPSANTSINLPDMSAGLSSIENPMTNNGPSAFSPSSDSNANNWKLNINNHQLNIALDNHPQNTCNTGPEINGYGHRNGEYGHIIKYIILSGL